MLHIYSTNSEDSDITALTRHGNLLSLKTSMVSVWFMCIK